MKKPAPKPTPTATNAAAAPALPAGRLVRIIPQRSDRLREIPMKEVASEILARIQEGHGFLKEPDLMRLANDLHRVLDVHLDVHENRFSRKRYSDMFFTLYQQIEPVRPPLQGSTWLDLGCGSVNPAGVSFMFLMLGARKGICVDLDEIQDVSRAVTALADCAALMLIDPMGIVGDHPITREEILRNISSFDLRTLRAGDLKGVDSERLQYLRESVFSLSLEAGSVDVVTSCAFLEHLPRMDAVAAELSRITRSGGFGIHIIDGTDHLRYWQPTVHPLAFLAIEPGVELVHDSNRIRPVEFGPIFERHGFEVLSFHPYDPTPVDDALRRTFLPPWRSMPLADLAITAARLVVRKR